MLNVIIYVNDFLVYVPQIQTKKRKSFTAQLATECPTTFSVTQKVSSELFTSSPLDLNIASNSVQYLII